MADSTAERVKERIDLVALIQESLPLKRAGSNFKARCPFHEEDTPSFIVSPSRQTYHCFGCSKHGDCFTWLMEREGMSFPEALRVLAQRAGVPVTFDRPERREERERLRATLDCAATFYGRVLVETTDGEAPRAYLATRGLTPETIAAWRLGFCPERSTAVMEKAKERGVTIADLTACGVLGQRGGEFFRGRILFPLADHHGSVVGIAGRVFEQGGASASAKATADKPADLRPKYINSPETLLYKKSSVLYGLDRAKAAIRKENLAVLVEGYTDVILSHQAGVTHVVATAGTALTEEHLRLLRRFTDRIAFAFDADAAGVTATRRAIDLALASGFLVSVVTLPADADPADLAVKNPETWRRALAGRQDVFAFLLARARTLADAGTPEGHKVIAADLLPLIAQVQDAVVQGGYVQQLAQLLGIDPRFVYEDLKRQQAEGSKQRIAGSRQESPHFANAPRGGVGKRELSTLHSPLPTPVDADVRREERLLTLLLGDPTLVPAVAAALPPAVLEAPATKALYTALISWYSRARANGNGEPPVLAALRRELDSDLQIRLDGLLLGIEDERESEAWGPRREVVPLVRMLLLRHLRVEIQACTGKLQGAPAAERADLLERVSALTADVGRAERWVVEPA